MWLKTRAGCCSAKTNPVRAKPPAKGSGVFATGCGRGAFYAGDPIGTRDCALCHADVAAQWGASAHRFSSFNNPYYRVSVERFRRDRGKPASQFCAGCHEPALAATLAMNGDVRPETTSAQSGIVCLACHSIDAVDQRGNGRYHATLAPFDGRSFAFDREQHRARLRPALTVRDALLRGLPQGRSRHHHAGGAGCAARTTTTPGTSAPCPATARARCFDPRRQAPKRCQDCHMPLEPAVGRTGGQERHGPVAPVPGREHRAAAPARRRRQERRTMEYLRGRASLASDCGPGPGGARRRADARARRRPPPAGRDDGLERGVAGGDTRSTPPAVIGTSGARGRDGALGRRAPGARAAGRRARPRRWRGATPSTSAASRSTRR